MAVAWFLTTLRGGMAFTKSGRPYSKTVPKFFGNPVLVKLSVFEADFFFFFFGGIWSSCNGLSKE